jgi:hypothetical protein
VGESVSWVSLDEADNDVMGNLDGSRGQYRDALAQYERA